jgi:hypothetical protein
MKRMFLFFWLCSVLLRSPLKADPIITFFFRTYPSAETAAVLAAGLRKSHTIAAHTIHGTVGHNPIAGIFSSYFGFINVSDTNGQTMFPRKQSSPLLFIVITNKISPIIMFQYTLSHWELIPGVEARMYRAEQKEDADTGLTLWDIKDEPLPIDNKIPVQNSLIIIAKPSNIVVPTGITLVQPSANLLLPEMYVKKTMQSARNALYMLNLSLFFRPIDLLYKKAKLSYETLVNE